MSKLFTPEELEELRRADEELDAEFRLTQEDIVFSRKMDKEAALDRRDNRGRKIADYQAAYYEANKEKIAAQKAAYREANKEKWNAYQREYRKRRKEKTSSDGANIESGLRNKSTAVISL